MVNAILQGNRRFVSVIAGLVLTSSQALGDVVDQGLRAEPLPYWRFVRNDGSTMGILTDGHWRLKAQWKYSLVALGHGSSWYNVDANSYCWQEGEGELDLSKPIYEVPSETADIATGTRREMGEYPVKCFYRDEHVTSIVFPRRSREFYGNCFAECGNLTNVVLSCDNLKICEADVFANCTNLVRLTLDIVAQSGNRHLGTRMFHNCPLSDSDASSWNLPDLRKVGEDAFLYRDGYAVYTVNGITHTDAYPGPYGTLRMPAVTNIQPWAFARRSRIEKYELGSGGLQNIGEFAFARSRATELNLGVAPDLTVGRSLFNYAMGWSSRKIRLTASVPSLTALTGLTTQTDGEEPKNYPQLIVSLRRNPEVSKYVSPPTADERAYDKYLNTAGVFVGSDNARKAWLVDEIMPGDNLGVVTELTAPGWRVDVVADHPADADGRYPEGTEVTLTVAHEADAKGSFYRWYGDVTSEDRTSPSVKVRLNGLRDAWVMPVVDREWIYVPTGDQDGYLSSDDWEIDAYRPVSAPTRLRIGHASGSGHAVRRRGTGVLNLNGPIKDAQGNPYVIHSFDYALTLTGSADEEKNVSSLVVPRNLLYNWPETQYMKANGHPSLETFIFDVTNALTGISTYFTCGHSGLRHFILRVPKTPYVRLESVNDHYKLDTDVSDWDLSGANRIGVQAFMNCPFLRGTLALPCVKTVQTNAFAGCAALTCVVLGSPKTNTVDKIERKAFSGCASLGSLTLNASDEMTVEEEAFAATALTNVAVDCYAPPRAALEGILEAVEPRSGDKACVVHGSLGVRRGGVYPMVGLVDIQLTAEEREAKPSVPEGSEVVGVFRATGDGPNLARAWIVHTPSAYDSRGIVLIYR